MNLNEEEKVVIPLYSTYFIFKFLDATWKKISHKICHLYILTVKLKNWFCLGIIFFFQIQINWLFLKKVTNILPLCAICWLFNNTVRFKIFCRQGETFLPRSVKSLSTLSFFVSLSPSLPLSTFLLWMRISRNCPSHSSFRLRGERKEKGGEIQPRFVRRISHRFLRADNFSSLCLSVSRVLENWKVEAALFQVNESSGEGFSKVEISRFASSKLRAWPS